MGLATCLSSEHDAENGHEDLISLSVRDVAIVKELCGCVVKDCEYCHFDELGESEDQANHVTLADCYVDWTIEESVIVGNDLFLVSERGDCAIV